MKKIILAFLLFAQFVAFAQQDPLAKSTYFQGMGYLKGFGKPQDLKKALELFWYSSFLGNERAMNALGNIYLTGSGLEVNYDSAFYWYKASANAGYTKAMLNLGQLYKTGAGTSQNFVLAAHYYKKGADLNDIDCKNALAYMFYKGFGVNQNYSDAFRLFKEAADHGNATAMYFTGLCFRNGYGIPVNADLSKYWLSKAAQKQEAQAIHELTEEPLPENISSVSPKLDAELTAIKTYKEKFQPLSSNNYEGVYSGYLIYYDWSGKYVHEIQPLHLKLDKQGNGYKGFWQEGDISRTQVSLSVTNNIFTFDSDNVYTRINHYSNRSPEKWRFNSAKLQLSFMDDSILLSGYVQFYSLVRKEPGKPLQVILKKNISENNNTTGSIEISLYPNPASLQSLLKFKLNQSSRIGIQISQENGSIVYTGTPKLLPPGTYTYPIDISRYSGGIYYISLIVNGKVADVKKLIKQ